MNGLINIALDPKLTNFSNPSWDSFLLLFYLISVVIYSFFANRERLTVVLISIYSALCLTLATPLLTNFLLTVDPEKYFLYKLGFFLIAFLVLYILFSQNMSLRAEVGHRWWQAIILSCLQVGLLMSVILSLLPQNQLQSTVAINFFTADLPKTIWMLGPVIVMVFMKKKEVN